MGVIYKTWFGCTVVGSAVAVFFLLVAGWLNWLHDPAWVTAAATLGTGIVLVVTAVFALRALEDARGTRHGALVTDLSQRWDDVLTVDSMRLYTDHGPQGITELYERLYTGLVVPSADDLDLLYRLGRWPNLIETVGVLHSEDVLSTDIVYKMWGPQIVAAWRVWAAPIYRLRELEEYPVTFRYFERLAVAMLAEVVKDDLSAAKDAATESLSEPEAEAERV